MGSVTVFWFLIACKMKKNKNVYEIQGLDWSTGGKQCG